MDADFKNEVIDPALCPYLFCLFLPVKLLPFLLRQPREHLAEPHQLMRDAASRHDHRHRHQNQGVDPEDNDGGNEGGAQGQAHPLHDLLGAVRAGNMGGSGYNQLVVVHHFLPPFFIRIFARAMEGARGRLAGHTKEQVPQLMHRSALSSWSCSTSPFS